MTASRRQFLTLSAAALALSAPGRLALAALPEDRRLVVVVLRGGMDGLHAVPPLGDAAYAAARGGLALSAQDTVPLDGFFALHKALSPLLSWWMRGELALVQAVATPYRQRSHFDAQDVLESGGARPRLLNDGWLGRAVALLGGTPSSALAVGSGVPQLLRSRIGVASWGPSPLPGLSPDTVRVLAGLYAADPVLAAAFEEGVQLDSFAADVLADDAPPPGPGFASLAGMAGKLLAAPGGPRVAVLDMAGWDTHTAQHGRMAKALTDLATGLLALESGLGAAWSKTVVVAVSEFGRTVAANGSGGSDHGTAGLALVAGGPVSGGKVLGRWPGLKPAHLHEGRDLAPTTDLRALWKAVLGPHLNAPHASMDQDIFPGSTGIAPLDGLLKV